MLMFVSGFFSKASFEQSILRDEYWNHSALALILASSTDLEKFKLHTVYSGILEQITPLQLVGQAAEYKYKSKFQVRARAFQLAITPEGYSRRKSKLLTEVNGPPLGNNNTGRSRVGASRPGQRQACCLSSRVRKV